MDFSGPCLEIKPRATGARNGGLVAVFAIFFSGNDWAVDIAMINDHVIAP